MNFKFKLRKGKSKATIISELRYGTNIRIRIATPYSLSINSAKYWHPKNQLLKIPNDILEANQINNYLNLTRTKIYTEFAKNTSISIADKNQITEKLRQIINPIRNSGEIKQHDSSRSKIVLNYYKWYIDFYSNNNSPNTGRALSSGTVKTYRNARRFLKDYLNYRNIKSFHFEDISKQFYYDFILYAQKSGYSRNYVGSMIQKLKTIIQSAYDEDLHSNGEFKKRYFRKFHEEVNHPYLTDKEILALHQLEIKNTFLDNVRDIFIIACYTGLRISDLMAFLKNPKIELFNNRKHILITQKKTKKSVFIPLKKIVTSILEKRNGKFPPYIHQNIINREIKPLLRSCGITDMYQIEKTVGGKTFIESKPKYKFISCHSARRSFCTNAYNSGVPLQDIMTFSGHSSEKMVLLYIKASAKEKAKRASSHEYFS